MATVVMNTPGWDANARQYKCCCNSCHVRTGVLVIGILEAIGLGLNIVSNVANFARFGDMYKWDFIGSVIGAVLSLIVLVLLFLALKTEKAWMLIPHLVLQVLGIIILLVLGILAIVFVATGGKYLAEVFWKEQNYRDAWSSTQSPTAEETMTDLKNASIGVKIGVGVAIMLAFIIIAIFEIWFFLVVLNGYRYLRDKARYGKNGPPGVSYGGPAVSGAVQPMGYPPQSAYGQGGYNPQTAYQPQAQGGYYGK